MNEKLNVLYEDNHIIVVEKRPNIPVQEDMTHDLDLLTIVKQYVKEKYKKPGNVYIGMVHRLDRPVGGIMVFARTSKAACRLTDAIKNHEVEKKYLAIVEGVFSENSGTYTDYLLKDERNNIVTVDKKGKKATLNYNVKSTCHKLSLVDIELITGRSHQIRVQFAHHGHPLVGDQKYNKCAKSKEQIALFAYKLSFNHPVTKEKLSFSLEKPDKKPWYMFE
ncbi:MAG: RluA family pseudouridine synthase [Bacilli bacterium]|nr:RluA family pseudouridine synthase [Bacilli bacterium]